MKPIRVLIIDDSAFARKVIREVLSKDPEIEVIGIARDGLEGLEKIVELKPDVVTLDLVMPELDGLGVLRALQKTWSPKVVVVSVSGSETELALEALHCGAVDLVAKPTPMASDRLYEISDELATKVKIAATSGRSPVRSSPEKKKKVPVPLPARDSALRLVVIGTSTGGPQALTEIFKTLPEGLPVVIAIALHIPPGYTEPLALRITQNSAIRMTEAKDGDELLPGTAVIAPGGMHLSFRRDSKEKLFAVVSLEPLETTHHPSVDVLFASAAEVMGSSALGVILTGMGSDGLEGAKFLRSVGGRVLAESAESCVVFGMPRSVIEAGLATEEAPLEQIANLLVENIYSTTIRSNT